MPRLPPSLLRLASRQSRHLRSLLVECRDLSSARNELRWLQEHVDRTQPQSDLYRKESILAALAARRSRGEPLQYIVGNQPFGELELLCKPNVLIPRWETEVYTLQVASLLKEFVSLEKHDGRGLKILDLCTGTGCIALLLHSLLRPSSHASTNATMSSWNPPFQQLQIMGVDLSEHALRLANQNLEHNMNLEVLGAAAREEVVFLKGDVLAPAARLLNALPHEHVDVVISNPPYISPLDYAHGGRTTRSVRKFEPKLALVPPFTAASDDSQADIFYRKVVEVAQETKAKLICMEVGDSEQAHRVTRMAQQVMKDDHTSQGSRPLLEIWCDDGVVKTPAELLDGLKTSQEGFERVVVVWTGSWALWRRINSR